MDGNHRGSTPFSLCILLLCALFSTVITAVILSINPCFHPFTRTLLAASGIDPYLVSCADDDGSLATLESDKAAHGKPIVTDLRLCGKPKLPPHALPPYHCCPPMSATEPINFTFPDTNEPMRTRQPVQAVGAEYMAKYARAIALMKALPKSDPRSFYQQANVHCAYCTGTYRQQGHPNLHVQIHFSWLFFPFHRAYLYFFERIVAKLLDDPGYALPFWSWDVPEGMQMPPVFIDPASPLYDPIRNPMHVPPKVADLNFDIVEKNLTDDEQIQYNLRLMYKQMISNAALPSLFHGQPFRAGDAEMPGPGTVELAPHNTMHTWTGDITEPNVEDMGVYYSAGRDPIFYPHHANIDRLWDAWRRLGHRDYSDPDWLDASFLFYDEEARLVSITTRDVIDMDKLRYRYDGVGLPWVNARPPVTPGVNNKNRGLMSVAFPVTLDAAPVTAEVRRPRVPRSRQEKDMEEEVLVVDSIRTDGTEYVKFDVYVNAADYEKVPPGGREMAESFACLQNQGEESTETSMRVALNEILEDLGAEGDDSVTVTLVPRRGKATIGGLRIAYIVE